ncbi:hypothetical protein Q8F57_044600 [Paraburkholderia terrae]|uniref:hypothetical protein n=1 Tax=Paraburkholderia terrae TaxID=311230 RepID=UPI00296AEDBC|nr:hypothetical protein [Paraburkholderia terrae]MDW3659801.1 hypothetical protein [Paraburkholderia terrae]
MMDGEIIHVANVPDLVAADVLMLMRLKDRGSPYSPERCNRDHQTHSAPSGHFISANKAAGRPTLSTEQKELLKTLNLPTPSADAV